MMEASIIKLGDFLGVIKIGSPGLGIYLSDVSTCPGKREFDSWYLK